MTTDDPLFGNTASELLNAAFDPTQPITDPRHWQPPPPEALQAVLPGYEVHAYLARGGMGAVYRGEQVSLGRKVAIKILPPLLRDYDASFAQRFKQEARAMAQLNHPGIVSVYDFGEMQDGTLYFIMEFIDGTDVAQMVSQQGRLSSAHAMAITAHVCDALQYAHEHGVVHRDIKPANIMVGYDGVVKVADFGLAKSINQQNTSLTVSGHVMGTPHFLAPEALTLGMGIDHRADIYAVGVMLYQMLTGKLPQGLFEMPSMQVPGLDPRYDAIVASAMREDREQRYQRILDMRHALDAILTQPVLKSEANSQVIPPSAASRPAMPPRPTGQPKKPAHNQAPQPLRKNRPRMGWFAVGGAAAAICAYFVWSQQRPAREHIAESLPEPAATVAAENPSPTVAGPAVRSVEVKLEFKNPVGFYDIGGYQPNELPMSTKVPRSIVKAPANLGPALYGELVLGPKAKQRTHAVIISHPRTPESKLFVDRNANGDLTDDPPVRWQPDKHSNATTKEQWEVYQGEFMADLSCDDGVHPARFDVFQNTSDTRPFDSLWIHPQYGRIGLVKLDDGKNYKALLYDDGAVGDFSAASSTFRIDLTGEGGFRKEKQEVFPVTQPFEIKGVTYQLRGLTPSGDKFELVSGSNAPQAPSATSQAKATSKPSAQLQDQPLSATNETPFTNSLGMRFAPVPGTKVLMCIHETRRRDYEAYAKQNSSVNDSWKQTVFDVWKEKRTLHDSSDHPVAFVGWNDAKAFCEWLGRKEGKKYRLPTDHEWSCAAGIGDQENPNEPPSSKDRKATGYPWGGSFPPSASNVGNYWDEDSSKNFPSSHTDLIGYRDGHLLTAPVMSYPANKNGIYDLGGNVWEWCEDLFDPKKPQDKKYYILRGASWKVNDRDYFASSVRLNGRPDNHEQDEGFRCVIEMNSESPSAVRSAAALNPETPAPSVAKPVAPSTPSSDLRTFTDTKGRTILAKLLHVNGDDVTLRLDDGNQVTFKTNLLSPADREYLRTSGGSVSATNEQTQRNAEDGEINLPLVAYEAAARFPEGRTFESPWSTERPPGLTGLPNNLKSSLYNTHFFDGGEGKQTFQYVLDDPESSSPRLFVDCNGNGDLSDDPVVAWKVGEHRGKDWRSSATGQARATIQLKIDSELKGVGLIFFYVPKTNGHPFHAMVELDYARMGKISVSGKSLLAALADNSSDDFRSKYSWFCVDLNNDGLFTRKDEMFPVDGTFQLGKQSYRLSGLTASGDSFRLLKN